MTLNKKTGTTKIFTDLVYTVVSRQITVWFIPSIYCLADSLV